MLYRGRKIADCNCGGPQYGTDHAPDCAMILDAQRVDEDLASGGEAAIGSLVQDLDIQRDGPERDDT